MLINRRNAMMTGERLPYDAELEYLERKDGSWIDTGVYGSDAIVATCTWSYNGNQSSASPFGARTSAINKAFAITGYSAIAGQNLYFNFGNTSGFLAYYGDDVRQYIWTCRAGVGRAWLAKDGVIVSNNQNNVSPFSTEQPISLFAYRNANGSVSGDGLSGVRIHVFALYNSNGVLVRDFIPVRKGTVGYMYDRVTKQLFGNAGTGDFVLGPDVVPVEWLETTGSQYIDTGVTCGSADTTVFEFDQSYSALQSGRFIWGSNYGANQGKDAGNYYVCGLTRSDVIMQTGVVYHCKTQVAPANAVKAYINGTLFRDDTGSSPYTSPFYIFRLGGVNVPDGKPSYLRIHHLTVSINNALVRSFRPVRVGTNATSWEGAMMDVLTRRIYRNAGTGAFTYGNDLKYPIPAS